MKKVKLGIIGCGVIGINHVKGALSAPDRVELTALCDIRPEAVKAAATQYKVPKAYTNPDELLADPDVEAVVLAIPLKGRPELGVKVLKAGKHLLMEKPLVRNMAEARALLAARGERVVACCSARHSVYPSARAAAKVVSDGLLGKVRLIRARGITACGPKPKNPPPVWRVSKELNGGGILVNWGVYDLDYLLSIVGAPADGAGPDLAGAGNLPRPHGPRLRRREPVRRHRPLPGRRDDRHGARRVRRLLQRRGLEHHRREGHHSPEPDPGCRQEAFAGRGHPRRRQIARGVGRR